MSAFNLISHLEGKLKAYISLANIDVDASAEADSESWLMKVNLFYENEPAGSTSFTLQGYSHDEAVEVARNLKSNQFLMKEIDELLWGESD